MVQESPASPVGARVAAEETAVATGTSLSPGKGSCAITATTPNGRTGEQERHAGVRGTGEEARPGGGEADLDRGPAVATT